MSGEYDCVLLPGGGPGAAALASSPQVGELYCTVLYCTVLYCTVQVGELLRTQDKAGKMIAAICAAPTALASHRQTVVIIRL